MSSKLVPIPDAVRDEALQLYLAHVPMNDIAARLKVSTATLSAWRSRDGWAQMREKQDEELAADIVSARKLTLTRIARAGIDQIDRTIKHIAERPEPMTVAEAEKMSVLVSNLDRIGRLDNKEATENVAVGIKVSAPLTPEQIKETIKADPFFIAPVTKTTEE